MNELINHNQLPRYVMAMTTEQFAGLAHRLVHEAEGISPYALVTYGLDNGLIEMNSELDACFTWKFMHMTGWNTDYALMTALITQYKAYDGKCLYIPRNSHTGYDYPKDRIITTIGHVVGLDDEADEVRIFDFGVEKGYLELTSPSRYVLASKLMDSFMGDTEKRHFTYHDLIAHLHNLWTVHKLMTCPASV